MSEQYTDSTQRIEQQAPTLPKKRGWKTCQNCNQFSPPASKMCKHDGCKAAFPPKTFNWDDIDSMGGTNPTHQRELLEKRANILYKKHKWDVVVFYFHPHGKGDTVSYYGTPGTAAKFLGLCESQEQMHPAGKGALNLFESFIDRERKEAVTAPVPVSSASTSRCTSTLSANASALAHSITTNSTTTTPSTNSTITTLSTNSTTTTPSTNSNTTTLSTNSNTTTPSTNSNTTTPSTNSNTTTPSTNSTTTTLSTNSTTTAPLTKSASTTLSTNSTTTTLSTNSTTTTLSTNSTTTAPLTKSASTTLSTNSTTNSSTNTPSTNFLSHVSSTSLFVNPNISPSLPINSSSQATSIINLNTPPFATSNTFSRSSSNDPISSFPSNKKLVAYVDNSTIKALGVPLESQRVVHGKTIPEGSVCVQVTTTTGPNIPAPIVLGDREENSFLKSGMFFAIPIRNLFNYVYVESKNIVQLSPCSVGS